MNVTLPNGRKQLLLDVLAGRKETIVAKLAKLPLWLILHDHIGSLPTRDIFSINFAVLTPSLIDQSFHMADESLLDNNCDALSIVDSFMYTYLVKKVLQLKRGFCCLLVVRCNVKWKMMIPMGSSECRCN